MAIVEQINGRNKTYTGLRRVIDYILREDKTQLGLYSGFNCDADNAYNDFIMTKRNYYKETGRQYIHFVQSFSNYEKVSAETVKAIADELLLMDKFKGFQVVYATHMDTDNLHTHFVLNTVNSYTGMKWKMSKEELQSLKDYSDEICRKYGLIITHGKKGAYLNRGEYRSRNKEKSWKYELFLAVKHAKRCSISKDDFIENLKQLGYGVNWSDKRKYITFINPDGKKCRNRKLYPPEKFTKEALLKRFDLNKQQMIEKVSKAKFDMVLSAVKLIELDDIDNGHGTGGHALPLSRLEGSAKQDEIAEMKKGAGFDWDKEKEKQM